MNITDRKKIQRHNSRGQALVITVLAVSAMMAIAFFIAGVIAIEVRLAGESADSIIAIMAADAGIEWMLYKDRKVLPEDPRPDFNGHSCDYNAGCGFDCEYTVTCYLENGSSFNGRKLTPPGKTIFVTVGAFGAARRALQVTF